MALIRVAQARLQLRRFLVLIEKYPDLLEGKDMAIEIKRPMELIGLKSRLLRSVKQEVDIAAIGKRYDSVLDEIDELKAAHCDHAGALENYAADLRGTIERMTGSNGDPNDDGRDGQKSESDGAGQVITSKTEG